MTTPASVVGLDRSSRSALAARTAFPALAAIAVAVAVAVQALGAVGCSASKTLPEDFGGTYTAADTSGPEINGAVEGPGARITTSMKMSLGEEPASLTVTPGGIAFQSGSPFGRGPHVRFGHTSVGIENTTSDLFAAVSCSGGHCSFATKSGCEGAIDRASNGNLRIVTANGGCAVWAGTWVRSGAH